MPATRPRWSPWAATATPGGSGTPAAAALGLAAGPGFSIGAATVVSVHGVSLGPVPALPLLAALPDTQAVPLLAFASQAVPALAAERAEHARVDVNLSGSGSLCEVRM